MSEFGWTRLAYLSVILTILAVLVKLGAFGAASLPESLPESVFAFNQSGRAVEEQYRDEKPAEAREEHPDGKHSNGEHSEEENADSEHDPGHSHEPVESLYANVDFKEDPPVFYRPAPQVSSAFQNPSPPDAKSCQTVGDAPPGSEILFPMTREHFNSYDDTWGAARPQGGHEGTDLMVPNGTPLLAMTDGRIVPVSGANGNGWNTLGGYTVMLEAAYSVGPVKKGDLFYYAHMDAKSDLRIGDTVETGDVVGYAGDTGQGPEGARGQFPPHLHLGWYETSGERTQLASGAMNPYPLLEWVKANGGSISGGSDIPYCEAPQSSAPTPSGGGYWQFPSDPGTRPDMSTGGGTAAPSPVVEQNDSAESSPSVTREERRPVRPNRPANPAPPEEAEPSTPPSNRPPNEPPSNGAPSIPNIPNPLPGIGAGIGDIIGGIFNPGPSEPSDDEMTEPTPPAPPEDTEAPSETEDPATPAPPPEDTPPGEAPPPEATPPEATQPEDTAPEEDTECEHGGEADEEETNEKPREHSDEDCAEDTGDSEEEPPPGTEATDEGESAEETTGPNPPEAVENQYEGEQPNPEAGAESPGPETTSGL